MVSIKLKRRALLSIANEYERLIEDSPKMSKKDQREYKTRIKVLDEIIIENLRTA